MRHRCRIFKVRPKTWVTECLSIDEHFNTTIRIDYNWLNCLWAGIAHCTENNKGNPVIKVWKPKSSDFL